jgi:inosose dehydratase
VKEGIARVAGAPITWGVSEVAGWGHQMAPERVLSEAASIGLRAMELGPPGFMPSDAASVHRVLEAHQLALVGGFLALVLHRAEQTESVLAAIALTADLLVSCGAGVLIVAADLGRGGYETGATLTRDDWRTLVRTLANVCAEGEHRGVTVALHPHFGTAIATAEDVNRLLESSDVALCVDTGHLMLGGADPAEVVRLAGSRVRHVHLKDVDARMASKVRSGKQSYRAAVAQDLYRPLGDGDVDIVRVVRLLDSDGYDGWYVLEQDTVLECEPPPGAGPVVAAERSMRFLEQLRS